MEGSVMGSAGHVDVHAYSDQFYVVGGSNVQCSCYTEHGRYDLSCLYGETVECMSSAGSE